MAFDYTSLRNTVVQPLIKDFGDAAVLLVPGVSTGPAYDPQPAADTEHACQQVQTDFTKEDVAGGNVQKDDRMFLVSPEALTLDPELPQRLRVDGTVYQIVRVKPLKPGPITMLWRVHVRK